MNVPFTILFILFMVIMAIHRIWTTLIRKVGERGQIEKKWTLSALTSIHSVIGIGAIIEYFFIHREINYIISAIGFGMFFVALLIRNWAIRSLGKYHSPHIEIKKNHKLIKNGPYAYIRHPYYVSVILEILGLPLIPNSYYTFLLALFVYIPFLFIRIRFEEKVMTVTFGENYSNYKKGIPGFLPIKKRK